MARRGVVLVTLLFATIVGALVLPGCSTRTPTGSGGFIPISVDVHFPSAGCPSCPAPNGTLGTVPLIIDTLRISAFEILADGVSLRASDAVAVDPADQTYQLQLRVPYAARYRISVEAIGQQGRTGYSTFHGLQFYGERVLDTTFGTAASLSISMINVVSLGHSGYTRAQVPYVAWCPVPFAERYTLMGTLAGHPDTFVSVPDTIVVGDDLPYWSFRLRAELDNGFRTAFSEPISGANYGCGF